MKKLKEIAGWFSNWNIQLFFVGGSVRNEIMKIDPEDYDVCIVGGNTAGFVQEKLETLLFLKHVDNITSVHGNFPVWIVEIEGEKYEFAMARKERKTGQNRQDFLCDVNEVTLEEDLSRRDITVNAIAKNIITGEIIDPFSGIEDIRRKIARQVSDAFSEDPLRVVRVARFIAKFNLKPTKELIELCKSLPNTDISNERVGMEVMKLFKSPPNTKVSKFFYFLDEINWLDYYFKELSSLKMVPQPKSHHPEGDAFVHTMYCIDAANEWFTRTVMLCHDLGKSLSTTVDGFPWKGQDFENARIQSVDHEKAGVEPTRNMLKRIKICSHETIKQICCLVELHMMRIYGDNPPTKVVRRTLRILMNHNLTYDHLVEVIYCDLSGRPPLKPIYPDIGQRHARFLLQSDSMRPIVTGKLLTDLGIKPGKEMGEMLEKALEFQDRGTLNKSNWKIMLNNFGFKQIKIKS